MSICPAATAGHVNILLTMMDSRTNNAKSIIAALRQTGSDLGLNEAYIVPLLLPLTP